MAGTINWVVALKPEAEAVIQKFRMKPDVSSRSLFPLYASEDGEMNLIVSGPGRLNAAAATSYLAGVRRDQAASGWINFGIAGSGQCDFGDTFLAGKVVEASSGKAWYPIAVWDRKVDLPRRDLVTVEAPVSDYPEKGALVEMEASGFCQTAFRAAGSELCQVLKTVSDDPEHPIDEIDREMALQLCQRSLEDSSEWLAAFANLVGEEAKRVGDPSGFQEWTESTRFSVTQTHQLKRLLQQWRASHPDLPDESAYPEFPGGDARSALKSLQGMIWDRSMD